MLRLDVMDDATPVWEVYLDGYKYVLFSKDKVLVYKDGAQEPTYEVSSLGCTCPADKYRSEACKHRKLALFVGDSSSGTSQIAKPEDTAIHQSSDGVIDILSLPLEGSNPFG